MGERVWDRFLTEEDRRIHALSGYGRRGGFGTRPALFIIDAQHNFCGDSPDQPPEEALAKYRTYCGPVGWRAVAHMAGLLDLARARGLPVFYTQSERRPDRRDSGIQAGKSHRGEERTNIAGSHATQVVAPLAPRPEDMLVPKVKPSAFFGTMFMSHLNYLDVDTLILTGCSTSGCLRATAVDAFSYNFRVVVPEECAFDRFEASHAMALFDMDCKYADVIPVAEVSEHLRAFPVNVA